MPGPVTPLPIGRLHGGRVPMGFGFGAGGSTVLPEFTI